MLWVDNYRPKTLDKVLFHEDIAQNLKKLVSEQDCPHLLFYGPLGSGKKTLIMALLREMFGASAEKEPPASVIDSNGAVTGHIILTIIGGKNGEPKQDIMMKEMHKQGITINDISKVLKTVPIHPRIVPTIKAAHAAGCDLRIVSDANRFFIETILSHLGLGDCFTEINTNPGYVDEQGRLRILPFHDFNTTCHGCNLCPPNMCKGKVIERLLSEQGHKKFIYLGDGIGDYCPSLKLRQGDHVMPRKNFPVWDLISSNPNLIRAQIHEWIDGEDLEKVVMSLIPSMSSNGDDKLAARLLAIDCKLETMPVSPHESLPKALSVTY